MKITPSPKSYSFVASSSCLFAHIKTVVTSTENRSAPAPSPGTRHKTSAPQWQRVGHRTPAQRRRVRILPVTPFLSLFPRRATRQAAGKGGRDSCSNPSGRDTPKDEEDLSW